MEERPLGGTDLERVTELAIDVLGEVEGIEAVRRLTSSRELRELDLPVILLVGGATGTGKSTVATEAAYRLGIPPRTSPPLLRQKMRALLSSAFITSIPYSSFQAAARLRWPHPAEDASASGVPRP